ncbi:LINE-1 reverse transcriptase-like [Vitis vinifera]|uniref:LINE-1 reverse transcriptase-like n=1 Tax=Vitis vinifera TaxID=29760 RepID=A0A438HAM7_VITVI|nr:LINE-1 reverse transcriptase-like [Vitis vinifera]
MRRFAQVVDELGLVDLQLQKGSFTWSGGLNNQSRARLDRFLVTPCWLDQFSRVVQRRLPKPTSDHFLVLLEGGSLRRGPTPFRFENMWFKVEGFKDLIRNWWCSGIWNAIRMQLSNKWSIGIGWKASRELWLKEGDRNTDYFHRMASAHRRANYMDKIKINGVRLTEEQEIREGVVNAFQQQLSESAEWRADIRSLQFNQINLQEAGMLELPFTEAEKGGAEDLGDFRPIGLLGGLYKLLAKVLANRLKKVIGKVVSLDQNAFVTGRQILDASLIENEVIDAWNKRGEKGIICKLDIEKAYDNINWQFLLKVMQKMGFGSKWLRWMWWCISTAKYSVMVNGVPASFFSSSKGLRQGDPLSPYLFVMGMEVLSVLIRRVVEGGLSQGVKFSVVEGGLSTLHTCSLPMTQSFFGEVEEVDEMAVELGCRVSSCLQFTWGCLWGAKQGRLWVGWGRRESEEETCPLEKTIYFKRRENHSYKEHNGKHANVSNVPLSHAQFCGKETRKTTKRFFVGRGNLERKAHLVNWEVEILKEAGWCWENLAFKVGKGNKIRFWTDLWCGDIALSQRFSHLFTLAAHRNATIEEMQLASCVEGTQDNLGGRFSFWKEGGNGQFRVKEAYSRLDRPLAVVFPKNKIWVERVPTKIIFFAWEATWGKIMTLDRLQKRG